MGAVSFITITTLLAATAFASPAPYLSRRDDGTGAAYVTAMSQCPTLTARSVATPSVHDARPDDFGVFMALGDSITAGAFAKGVAAQGGALDLTEWRGVSYAAGGDAGAITVPNLISHYRTSAPVGASVGSHGVEICFGIICPLFGFGWNSNVDHFNAAQTGALASNLMHEARDYLVPQYQKSGIHASVLKYMSFQIGSNDICQTCLEVLSESAADDFEATIREVLEYVRAHIPNVLVNIVGVFKVSQIYNLTLNQDYCDHGLGISGLQHINWECSCALLENALGDDTRKLMDEMTDEYNARLEKIVADYQTQNYAGFATLWQPADLPLATYPIQALSDVDCFHPATITHEQMAMSIFSRLTLNQTARAELFAWEDTPTVRCLQEGDRINTKALLY